MSIYKQKIIDAVQQGLTNAFFEKQDLGLPYNNHSWVSNYNFIFSELETLDGKYGLHIRSFQRHGYKIPCIYNEDEKTLFTLCSVNKLKSLRGRSTISAYHYTDAFSLLSSHEGNSVQYNFFGEEVEIKTNEDLITLLTSLMVNFNNEFDIKEYCILSCKFNHSTCQLDSVAGNYMARNYDVIKEDKSWNDYIIPNIELLENNEQITEAEEYPIDIKVKNNIKIAIKDRKYKEKEEDEDNS